MILQEKFNVHGPYRVLRYQNEWYVIGNGEIIPMLSSEQANEFVWSRTFDKLTWTGIKIKSHENR